MMIMMMMKTRFL